MKGCPKYKVGDLVRFKYTVDHVESEKCGSIYIVDKYGVIEDGSDVSYDVMIEEENCLYKHINEKFIIGKKEI